MRIIATLAASAALAMVVVMGPTVCAVAGAALAMVVVMGPTAS